MADEAAEFRLKPEEDWLFGVDVSDGNLRFGAAGGALLWASIGAILGVIMVATAFFAPNSSILFRCIAPNLTPRPQIERAGCSTSSMAPG